MDRTVGPAPGEIRPYEFPEVHRGRLDNGMAVQMVPKVPLPLVTVMAVLDAGETTAGQAAGLANLAGDALEGGTGSLSGQDLAVALETIGASFGTATGWDSTTVSVSCLAEHLPRAVSLLSSMVRDPAFEPAEWDRYRAQNLASVRQRRMDPASLASDSHARFLYAEGATYGRPAAGTEASLQTLTPADGHRFVGERYRPSGTGLVVVGDVQPEEVREAAEGAFGDWTGEAVPAPEAVTTPRQTRRVVHVVHRPGSVQSEIRVGHVGVPRSTEDFFALRVMNLALGGSFSSRLNLNLRERNGFTYGIRSRFLARRGSGPFVVSTGVENAVTAAAVREIFKEVEGMVQDGPTEDEVGAATSYLAGVFPLRMETTGQLASRVAELLVFGLPVDYYQTYRDRIRAVDRVAAAAAARAHIRPQELCTVVVGDADAVASDLEGLGVGEVIVHREGS